MGFPSFPQNTSWQRMKGNATFRIPSFASVTRMPPTTPEHSQLEQRVCVCVCVCVHVSVPPRLCIQPLAVLSNTKTRRRGCDASESRTLPPLLPDTPPPPPRPPPPPLPPLPPPPPLPSFVCAHFIPCAASWQAGQGLPSHHTPFPSHAAWGRNTRGPRQGQAQTAHTTLPPSPPLTILIGGQKYWARNHTVGSLSSLFFCFFFSPLSSTNYTSLVSFCLPSSPSSMPFILLYIIDFCQ